MAPTLPDDPLRDRFRGALLGLFVGDALGMPVEGWPRSRIRKMVGEVREMLDARRGAGTYTDDTQMALALAEALLDSAGDEIDLDQVAARFAARYDPERGYGGNARRILAAIARGRPWREVVEEMTLPGGSWANGAAMRVAPVALAFYPDRERVARAAEAQAEVTGHGHPLGRSGARLQALAVHAALESGAAGEDFPVEQFVGRDAEGMPEEIARALGWLGDRLDASPEEAVRALGTGGRASHSVPAALWAFLSRRDEPEEAIVRAVNLGGDTDTIGAMTGALTGAFHGVSTLPRRWVEALEDGEHGRSYALDLADRLYTRLGNPG